MGKVRPDVRKVDRSGGTFLSRDRTKPRLGAGPKPTLRIWPPAKLLGDNAGQHVVLVFGH